MTVRCIKFPSYARFPLGLSLVCLIYLILNAYAQPAWGRQSGVYHEKTLSSTETAVGVPGLKDCLQSLQLDSSRYLSVCRQAGPKGESTLHLFLVDRRQTGKNVIAFRSPGFGDAYYVKLAVFSKDPSDGPDLVLAESGAEFSYGVSVYTLNDAGLKLMGDIDAVLDKEGVAASVVPALRITDDGTELVFAFSANVMLPDRQGNYTEVPANQLSYTFDGKKLRRSKPVPAK